MGGHCGMKAVLDDHLSVLEAGRPIARRHRHQTISRSEGGRTGLSLTCLILPHLGESFEQRPVLRYADTMQIDELRSLISRHARPDGSTPVDGVMIARHDASVQEFATSGTVMALIAQGE